MKKIALDGELSCIMISIAAVITNTLSVCGCFSHSLTLSILFLTLSPSLSLSPPYSSFLSLSLFPTSLQLFHFVLSYLILSSQPWIKPVERTGLDWIKRRNIVWISRHYQTCQVRTFTIIPFTSWTHRRGFYHGIFFVFISLFIFFDNLFHSSRLYYLYLVLSLQSRGPGSLLFVWCDHLSLSLSP